ncbi:MAG: ATP-binding protein [Candidatus Korobacteraceae bacterium]
MLTRVYIDNFLCFVNFEYRPERKQLLLGPNGSGKSSLIRAIRDLKRFVKGDENPFTQSTRTRWQDRPLQVFELDAHLDEQDYEYRVEIQFAKETREQSVNLERLTVSGTPVFELTKGEIRFFRDNSKESTGVPFRATKSALQLSHLSNSHVRRFAEWLDTVHCISIDAYPGEMDEVADNEQQQPEDDLGNFAPWYRYLIQEYPEDNVRFLSCMRESLNGFQTLRFAADEDGTRKLWADFVSPSQEKANYRLSELSEGQRCLLGLYAVLQFLITKRETVFIDEPDNFISLREIQPWLLAAEQAVEDSGGQLILISHHPELLNQWAVNYGLLFFRAGNDQVRTERFRADQNGILLPSELIARGWENE